MAGVEEEGPLSLMGSSPDVKLHSISQRPVGLLLSYKETTLSNSILFVECKVFLALLRNWACEPHFIWEGDFC